MPRIPCRALLLDMDGVLVDSTPAVARVWARWAAKHNFDPVSTTQKAHGRTSISSIQELFPKASPEFHQQENDWMEREEIGDVHDVIALPGALELFSFIPHKNLAVVTSATHELAEVRLRAAGILPFVRNLITADDVQRSKPNPEPYLKGASVLGFPAKECVVIEDAPSGILAGKAAGATVIALRTTTHDEELLAAGADWIVNDCASLHSSIESPGGKLILDFSDDPHLRRLPKMS